MSANCRDPARFGRFTGLASCATLKRAGTMMMVALCKAALLVAVVEASTESLESKGAQCAQLELANPLTGASGTSRHVLLRNHAERLARDFSRGAQVRGVSRVPAARAAGHRLANGILAPMQC